MTRRPIALFVALCATTFALGACSGGSTAAPSPTAPGVWAPVVAQVLAHDPSDFVVRVLADGNVSDQEYQEAQDLYTSCMADRGVVVQFSTGSAGDRDLRPAPTQPSADIDAVNSECGPASIDGVQEIYLGLHANPEGLDDVAGVRQCLKEHGLTDFENISDAELQQGLDDRTLVATTPDGALCLLDPFGQYGVTAELAWMSQQSPKTEQSVGP